MNFIGIRSILLILGTSTAVTLVPSSGLAQRISTQEARARVASVRADEARIIERYPALSRIDQAVRSDCAAKNEGTSADSDFCGCAAAVTMSLWRSGIDPQMITRLQDYLSHPETVAPDSFLAYQGPELYRPLCALALRR